MPILTPPPSPAAGPAPTPVGYRRRLTEREVFKATANYHYLVRGVGMYEDEAKRLATSSEKKKKMSANGSKGFALECLLNPDGTTKELFPRTSTLIGNKMK